MAAPGRSERLQGRYGDIDSGRLTKVGVLLGATTFVLGAAGELIGHALYGSLPARENALRCDAEIIGILLVVFSAFVFGLFVPLTE